MAEPLTLIDHVWRALARAEASQDIVAAVSGGPDSVALLCALVQAGNGHVVVAHFNHGLRGGASDADEAFVRDLTSRLSGRASRLSFKVLHWRDQPSGGNLEALARRERYDWLARVAQACGIRWIATGHTADDQAETVLFRLMRGTGLEGLGGIREVRFLDHGVAVVRPMLSVTRQNVLDFLAGLRQDYRTDETNADRRFTRNRIRHELLPLLAREYNPRVREVLSRLASQAADAYLALGDAAVELLDQASKPSAGRIEVLDAKVLAEAPAVVVRRAWRLLWSAKGWPMGEMGYREWTRLAELAQGRRSALDLPGGIRVRRKGRVIQVGPANGGS
jgi:tRNA(Ile)-lysidine synthase